ncbi:MAG: hypothetical protein QOI90_659, partial [Mycobacterium sp.]|nr:hypothetical protein [Mycobacterium sp.]
MSLLASPSLTRLTTSRSVGVSDSPATDRTFAFTTPALCVGDRLLKGHCGALRPCFVKVVLPQCVTQRSHCGVVSSLVNLEADEAEPLANRLRRTQESCRCAAAAPVNGQTGEALEDTGNVDPGFESNRRRQRIMGIAFRLHWLTLRNRDASA